MAEGVEKNSPRRSRGHEGIAIDDVDAIKARCYPGRRTGDSVGNQNQVCRGLTCVRIW